MRVPHSHERGRAEKTGACLHDSTDGATGGPVALALMCLLYPQWVRSVEDFGPSFPPESDFGLVLTGEWQHNISFRFGEWIVKARAVLREDHLISFIDELYDGDLHAKRVVSLAHGTLGVLTSASLAVHAIGQGLAHARGTLSKHGVKQVDRLLSNSAIEMDDFFSHWVPQVIGAREEVVMAVDWTNFAGDGHDTLMLSMLTEHGRATGVMWETVSTATLKDNRNRYEDELLYRFSKVVPEGVKLTVVADRGFADCNLFK